MLEIEKKEKIGEGAYGMVYEGAFIKNNKSIKIAIKRNFGDEELLGIKCLREMSFLSLFNHPCINKLKSISTGDPFKDKNNAMTPLPKNRNNNDFIEDTKHFILEFAEGNLDDFIKSCKDYYYLKVIMCQILLGIEYIHSKGVIHRDLKPANILIHIEDDLPYAKICDFGMSCHPSRYRPSTPGTVTHCYRAPEICCEYEYYSTSSDMWSLGCIFYEMFTKSVLVSSNNSSTSSDVFTKLINILPEEINSSYLNEYISNGKTKFKHKFKKTNKKHFETLISSKIDIKKFDKEEGCKFSDFLYILENLLILDSKKRLSATECLNHKFFDFFRDFINDMRKKYSPIRFEDSNKKLKIINCVERLWAVNCLYKIYNNYESIDWYNKKHQIIFHAMRMFDEYLVYSFENNKDLRNKAEEGIGRLHTKYDTEIYIYTCVYMIYKYLNTLDTLFLWKDIFPDYLAKDKNIKKIEDFENFYIEKIALNKLYSETPLEYLDRDYIEKSDIDKRLDVLKYFINYTNIEKDYEGTMEDLYLQIREGLKI
jgi:serine/threonine protein kinase